MWKITKINLYQPTSLSVWRKDNGFVDNFTCLSLIQSKYQLTRDHKNKEYGKVDFQYVLWSERTTLPRKEEIVEMKQKQNTDNSFIYTF
jgi:hypothetical protein